ncbi:Chaperone protein dnaJ [Lithohypha guttulata]|uniref:Chaperone protein dnaJ n=1 Tax=Lithohypha guttulata TaxID=1690604 RepID=UPI00315DE6C7
MASTTKAEGHRRDTSHREHGLFTPGPEQARLDADKERQLQESAQSSSIAEDGSQDSALSTQSKPEADVESTASTEAEDDQGKRSAPTPAQIEAMNRVLACQPRQYRKILDLGSRDPNSQADREKIVNSFRRQGCLTHPDYNLAPQAEKAFKSMYYCHCEVLR